MSIAQSFLNTGFEKIATWDETTFKVLVQGKYSVAGNVIQFDSIDTMLYAIDEDVANVKIGDFVVVESKNYVVKSKQPLELGVTALMVGEE